MEISQSIWHQIPIVPIVQSEIYKYHDAIEQNNGTSSSCYLLQAVLLHCLFEAPKSNGEHMHAPKTLLSQTTINRIRSFLTITNAKYPLINLCQPTIPEIGNRIRQLPTCPRYPMVSQAHVNSLTSKTFCPSTKAAPVIFAMPTYQRWRIRQLADQQCLLLDFVVDYWSLS